MLGRRVSGLLIPLLLLVIPSALAWDPVDHQIFSLRDEVIELEGASNATFYSFLGVSPSATIDDIKRNQRKRAKQLHPDKAIPSLVAKRTAAKSKSTGGSKGVKVQKGPSAKEKRDIEKYANERYARLSTVKDILISPGRERYDYFLANGFPVWRGTGYYYARFRPGLGSVLVGLILVFGGGAHYGALFLGWKRHRDFVDRYISNAREMAWGNENGIPGLDDAVNGATGVPTPQDMPAQEDGAQGMALNRRQKRMQERENKKKDNARSAKSVRSAGISRPVSSEPIGNGPMGSRKKVVAENGKVLIVDSEGNVFLEETSDDGEKMELLLDPDEIPRPTIFQTALFQVPLWAWSQVATRTFQKEGGDARAVLEDQDIMINNPENQSADVIGSATSVNENAEARKRKSKGRK